ncbi:MAG TPA: BON domain-containing protein [Blastocatellia bacterium]|nr:BON domain-containing protein [Blastocatellia bacterium]
MKKTLILINAFALTAALAIMAAAQTPAPAPAKAAKPAKMKAAAAPKSDEEIQKCISDKLEASAALKGDGFSASVAGGVATLTGTTKVAGHKGGAGSIAKGCGAKSTQNNITVEKAAKMEKTTKMKAAPAEKAEPAKKP